MRSAPQPVILFDDAGLIVDWSPASERLLGYGRGEVIGRDILTLVFPARLQAALKTIIASRGAAWGEAARQAIEVSVVTRGGETIPVEMTLSWASGPELFALHLTDSRQRGDREVELAADARRRAAVNELGRIVVSSAADIDAVLAEILEVAAEFGGLDSCEFWERDAERTELVLRSAIGPRFGRARRGYRIRLAPTSRLAEALREGGEPIVFGDRLLPDPLDESPLHLGNAASRRPGVAVMVGGSGKTLGVLTGLAGPGVTFGQPESAHLTSLSILIASALERQRFEATISSTERRLRHLIERLPAITYSAGLGPKGSWHFLSPQVEEVFGFTAAECLGDRDWWERQVHPDDLDWVLAEELRCAAEGDSLDVTYRMFDKHGRALWVRDRASIAGAPDSDRGEVIVEGLLVDVTAQKQAELKLRHDVEHDALTGLLNRRGFEERLDSMLDAGATGFIAVVDIDHMKRLNDGFGHAAGDDFLRLAAARLRSLCGRDGVVARLSSDEFVLHLPVPDEDRARAMLEEIVYGVGDVPAPMQVTASAGAVALQPATSCAEFLAAADLALYRSKRSGRSRVTIEHGADVLGVDWVNRVRDAISTGKLTLFAQPIYDLRTGRLGSEELLVRMLAPDGSPIAAGQFVPAVERFGLINEVDRFVIARAAELASGGRPVNVNLSAASIPDREITEIVARTLGSGSEQAGLLTFEVTETGPTPPLDALGDFAERVAALGCRLSLDDVGTGFGSLTYLQNVAFDQIKIDTQFVSRLGDSETDAAIVRSLVSIARELGLETVGEGITSEPIRLQLRDLGVDCGQGFHLGSPAPLATMPSPWQPTSQN